MLWWMAATDTQQSACQYALPGGPARPAFINNELHNLLCRAHRWDEARPFKASCQTRQHANAGYIDAARYLTGEPGAEEIRPSGSGTSEGRESPLSPRKSKTAQAAVRTERAVRVVRPTRRIAIPFKERRGAIRVADNTLNQPMPSPINLSEEAPENERRQAKVKRRSQ